MQGPKALDKMNPPRRSLDDLDLRLEIGKSGSSLPEIYSWKFRHTGRLQK
jgi:hypothetical protein